VTCSPMLCASRCQGITLRSCVHWCMVKHNLVLFQNFGLIIMSSYVKLQEQSLSKHCMHRKEHTPYTHSCWNQGTCKHLIPCLPAQCLTCSFIFHDSVRNLITRALHAKSFCREVRHVWTCQYIGVEFWDGFDRTVQTLFEVLRS